MSGFFQTLAQKKKDQKAAGEIKQASEAAQLLEASTAAETAKPESKPAPLKSEGVNLDSFLDAPLGNSADNEKPVDQRYEELPLTDVNHESMLEGVGADTTQRIRGMLQALATELKGGSNGVERIDTVMRDLMITLRENPDYVTVEEKTAPENLGLIVRAGRAIARVTKVEKSTRREGSKKRISKAQKIGDEIEQAFGNDIFAGFGEK